MPKIEAGKINLYYELHGQGHPLVLISGCGQDHSHWIPLLPTLAEHFQVLIFDNKGCGQSDVPDDPYRIENMADETFELMDGLGIEKAFVIGHSMGGAIAQCLALKHPEKIDKLILAATSAKFSSGSLYFFQTLLKLMQEGMEPQRMLELLIPWVFSDAFISQPNKIQIVIDHFTANPYPMSETGLRRQCEALTHFNNLASLKKISIPVLIIAGRYDFMTTVNASKALLEGIPKSALSIIEGVSHDFIIEAPQELIKQVFDFFGNSK